MGLLDFSSWHPSSASPPAPPTGSLLADSEGRVSARVPVLQKRRITSWSSSKHRLAIGGFRRPRVCSSNRPFTRRFTLNFFSSSSFCSMRNFFNGFCRLSEKPLHSVRRGKNHGLLLGAPPNTRDYFLQQHLSKISPGSQS